MPQSVGTGRHSVLRECHQNLSFAKAEARIARHSEIEAVGWNGVELDRLPFLVRELLLCQYDCSVMLMDCWLWLVSFANLAIASSWVS